jgi:molybdopterin converting factor small subunit
MISVRCLGHIGTSVGAKDVELDGEGLDPSEIVEKLRERSGDMDPGFNRYNTLMMVEDGEAFVPATASRKVKDGERIILIPFSHGG